MPVFNHPSSLDDPLAWDACTGFAGGQVSNTRANLLEANQLASLLNCDISRTGEVVTRRGSVLVGAGLPGPIQGLAFYDTPADQYLVAAAASQLWKFDGGSWSPLGDGLWRALDSIRPVEFAQGINTLYFTDGAGALTSWDGTSVVNVSTVARPAGNNPPPVAPRFLAWHTGRIVAAGMVSEPDAVYFSDSLDGANWDVAQQQLRVGGGEGDPIAALVPWTNFDLLTLKRHSIWVVGCNPSGADPAGSVGAFPVTLLNRRIGCTAPRSAVQVGDDVFFLSDTGVRSVRRSVATEVVSKLLSPSAPAAVRFLASTAAATAANAAAGTINQGVEQLATGKPLDPSYSLERGVQDTLFGTHHAVGEMGNHPGVAEVQRAVREGAGDTTTDTAPVSSAPAAQSANNLQRTRAATNTDPSEEQTDDTAGTGEPTSTHNATTDAEPGSTITANAVVDEARNARGLDPIDPVAQQDFGTAWEKSGDALAADPLAGRNLVAELNAKPRALNDEENALLLRRQVEAQTAFDRANDAMNAATPQTLDAARAALGTATDELYDVHAAARAAGAETGRGLNARKMLSTEQYELSSMLYRKRAANDGKPLTEAQTAQVRQAHARIAVLEAQVAAHERTVANPPAAPDSIKRAARTEAAKPLGQRKSVTRFLDEQAAAARARIVARRGNLNIGFDPMALADELIIGASHIAHGATNFAGWSQKMLGEFGERIRPHLENLWSASNRYHDQSARQTGPNDASLPHERTEQSLGENAAAGPAYDPVPVARSGGTARPLESAESHVRGGARPVPTHDEPTGQREDRAASEERKLRQWAFDQYDDPRMVTIPRQNRFGEGAEHEVFLNPNGKRVTKVTRKSEAANYGFGISLNNDGRGATAGEYLDRLRLHNEIFNDDVRIEGVQPTAGGTRIITSQPYIKGEPAEPPQIDASMAGKGFDKLAEGTYYNRDAGVLVHDMHSRNALVTPEGKVRAIDPAIMRATPEMAESIRRMAARAKEPTPARQAVAGLLEDQAAKARARIVARRGQLNAFGALPQVADEAIIGAAHIARGVTRFTEWSKAMMNDFGEKITPQLSRIWREAKAYHSQSKRELAGPGPTLEERMMERRKRSVEDRTAELQARIAGADYVKPAARQQAALDAEGQRLKAEHERAKDAFDAAVERDRLAKRPMLQKVADGFVKVERAFKLTGATTTAKLSGAALARTGITPIEEVVGSMLGRLPGVRGVAARAPREGGFSLEAERAALGSAGLLKGLRQIPKVLATGKSDLDVLHGGRSDLAPGARTPFNRVLDLPGAVHGAIKNPVKYSEFARATAKRTAHYERAGLDTNSPLVKARIATESYQDAQRSIFMQENPLNAAYCRAIQTLETNKTNPKFSYYTAKGLEFLLPIVKVPTNVIGESLTYATGLETGAVRLTASATTMYAGT